MTDRQAQNQTRDPDDFDGMFAGQFDPAEYEPLIATGLLRFSYEGAAGFMGLAKLRRTEKHNG